VVRALDLNAAGEHDRELGGERAAHDASDGRVYIATVAGERRRLDGCANYGLIGQSFEPSLDGAPFLDTEEPLEFSPIRHHLRGG
jgi:hypothetical protein